MAADHIKLGKLGEDLAKAFIEEQEFTILYRNYRWSRAEIDIIAKSQSKLHFIEVKTRSWQDSDLAEEAVTERQQNRIIDAASNYMETYDYQGDFQFDIITVLIDIAQNTQIKWIRDAFGFWD